MDGLQVVCFAVGPYQCALEILGVREIIEPTPPSAVPDAAPGVEGVIELRGTFLPVIDLRRRLGVHAGAPGKYVVAQPRPDEPGHRVALVVDQVHDVRRWRKDQLAPPPALALGSGAPPCVAAVVHQEGGVVMLLDLARLLAPPAAGTG